MLMMWVAVIDVQSINYIQLMPHFLFISLTSSTLNPFIFRSINLFITLNSNPKPNQFNWTNIIKCNHHRKIKLTDHSQTYFPPFTKQNLSIINRNSLHSNSTMKDAGAKLAKRSSYTRTWRLWVNKLLMFNRSSSRRTRQRSIIFSFCSKLVRCGSLSECLGFVCLKCVCIKTLTLTHCSRRKSKSHQYSSTKANRDCTSFKSRASSLPVTSPTAVQPANIPPPKPSQSTNPTLISA